MRIIVDYNNIDLQTLEIVDAKYLGEYLIKLIFNDHSEKLVDFKPFLTKSQHPSIVKYIDEKQFSKFKIIDGNLNWNDYEMIFPIWDLYSEKIVF